MSGGELIVFKVNAQPVLFQPRLTPVVFRQAGGPGPQGLAANTDMGICFSGPLSAAERVGFVVAGATTYQDIWCIGKIAPGTAPAAPEALKVYRNNVQIGTVTVNTDASVTWAFGTAACARGDDIEVETSNTPSQNIRNLKLTFSGPI